jgi:RimJ/RimL family protein N-acetyltransferase
MRDNWYTSFEGEKAILVPYRKKFVGKYHNWMQDPILLEATASEPLTIEEEYEMQLSWHSDEKKCTFIVLAKEIYYDAETNLEDREIESMAGDVNLFFHDYDNSGNAEVDIMIPEERFRRKGIASEAVKLILNYGSKHLKAKRFFAKINEANVASIELFKRYEEV